MKTKIAMLTLALAITPASLLADEKAEMKPHIDASKAAIQDFFGVLKGELVKGMKEGGPTHAIDVCHKVAEPITTTKAQEHDMDLARTSLKVRNPNNAPDAWETEVLQEFDKRKAAGEDPMKIAHAEIVEENGQKQFRFMKAIPTGEVCLKCHGTEIAPEVQAKIDEFYPEDQAVGYSLGEIRGAFTIKKDI
jgi:hypothetical protein